MTPGRGTGVHQILCQPLCHVSNLGWARAFGRAEAWTSCPPTTRTWRARRSAALGWRRRGIGCRRLLGGTDGLGDDKAPIASIRPAGHQSRRGRPLSGRHHHRGVRTFVQQTPVLLGQAPLAIEWSSSVYPGLGTRPDRAGGVHRHHRKLTHPPNLHYEPPSMLAHDN